MEKNVKSDQQTYVLKLYDRSVDLAQFSPNTPLYPVCRSWIKNQPNNPSFRNFSPRKMEEKNDKEDGVKVEDKEGEVRSLPLPDPMPFDVDTRLPADLNPPEKLSSLDFLTQESPPLVSTLLSEHLSHWWNIRRQWRQAAAVNEMRYGKSIGILKNILVRP